MTLPERLVNRLARRTGQSSTSRRNFLGGATLVGAALAVDPWGYLSRPASAYSSLCGTNASCADGYSVFCCTINGGHNSCPPDSFIGGWWKADHSSFCGGSARYYIDCNAYRDGHWRCRCNDTSCDHRLVACNQFRYGQCNLQIPYSDTGPVLCRVVSCTPPWHLYGGVCTSSSLTDNNTVGQTAPCVGGHPPVGRLDYVATHAGVVHLRGWAYDPDRSGTSIQMSIHEDARLVGHFPTNVYRADVNSLRHITGHHGFDIKFTGHPGRHVYGVYAVNIGPKAGNPLIASRALTVQGTAAPVGRLDVIEVAGANIHLRGWAYDPDQPSTSIQVAVHADSTGLGRFPAALARPDVNTARHITGKHGFDFTVPARVGTHTYRVFAINLGGGSANPQIGARSLTLAGPADAAGAVTR